MVCKKASTPYGAFDFSCMLLILTLFPISQADEGVIFVGLSAAAV